jgi:hypothetical protein
LKRLWLVRLGRHGEQEAHALERWRRKKGTVRSAGVKVKRTSTRP